MFHPAINISHISHMIFLLGTPHSIPFYPKYDVMLQCIMLYYITLYYNILYQIISCWRLHYIMYIRIILYIYIISFYIILCSYILSYYIFFLSYYTSSTAEGGGGGSFKNRKPIGEVGCCESQMAERSHSWTERWLRSRLLLSLSLIFSLFLSLSLSFSDYLPT